MNVGAEQDTTSHVIADAMAGGDLGKASKDTVLDLIICRAKHVAGTGNTECRRAL